MAKKKVANKTGRGKAPSPSTVREIWARSGGICAFPDCEKVLYEDPYLLESKNFGEIAHNVSSNPGGPRGDPHRSHALSDDPANLILFCPFHHEVVDKDKGKDYPEEVLRAWKQTHEDNVKHAVMLKHAGRALPLIIRGPIGGQQVTINPGAVVKAMIAAGIAPLQRPFSIEVDGDGDRDDRMDRWKPHVHIAKANLNVLRKAEIVANSGFAVFPLAEMPLLMYVGHLLGDKTPLQIYQYRRSANTWEYEDLNGAGADFTFALPPEIRGKVAISLGITAPIEAERIRAALGAEAAIIEVAPSVTRGVDVVKGPKTIQTFRARMRTLLDQLETRLPRDTELHVFPAMPAPLAFVFGTCVMPKVSQPLMIYDARGRGGPFHVALRLPDE